MNETKAHEAELRRLKDEKAALQVQSRLLEKFVTIARSANKKRVLTDILQKTLEISTELTGAEKGSLFLLDFSGAVTDSILTRAWTRHRTRAPELSEACLIRVLLFEYDNIEKWD